MRGKRIDSLWLRGWLAYMFDGYPLPNMTDCAEARAGFLYADELHGDVMRALKFDVNPYIRNTK